MTSLPDVKEALTKIFKEVDLDHSGQIDAKEVENALRKWNCTPECKNKWDETKVKQETATFLKEADKDKDSKVTLKEFVDYYAPRFIK